MLPGRSSSNGQSNLAYTSHTLHGIDITGTGSVVDSPVRWKFIWEWSNIIGGARLP